MPWGLSNYSDPYSEDPFGFASLFGNNENRFRLSNKPSQEMDQAYAKSVADDDVKKARKDKWMNVVSMLPAIMQIFASDDSSNVASALQNIQDIMEHRKDTLVKQQEAEKQREFELGTRREELGFRRGERVAGEKFQSGESEKERTSRKVEKAEERKFQLDLTESERKWQTIRDEIDRRHKEKLARMGIAADTANQDRQTRILLGQQLRAGGLSIEAADEASSILALGGSIKDLSNETQAAIKIIDAAQGKATLFELNSAVVNTLNDVLKLRVPVVDPITGEVVKDLQGKEFEKPIISADVLGKLDPEWAKSVFGLDKILPPSEVPAGTKGEKLNKTVAQAGEENSMRIGVETLNDPRMQEAVKKIGETNNLSNAAQFAQTIYQHSGSNAATAFSMIDNLNWSAQMKEAARQTIRELEKQKSVANSMGSFMGQ